jgi:phosphatidylserine decarboxylase
MFTRRTLLEGKWPILILAALSFATWRWCPVRWAPVLPVGLLAFTISFFRDPEANVPADEKSIVAPATGKIVDIKPVNDRMMVAIFLSVFDVHVQRAPVAGKVVGVEYKPGRFLDARNPDASARNESRWIEMETADGLRVTVRQIAGLIARRIVGWADTGATLTKGQRIGMIRFGSRVELFLPPGTEVAVKVGDYAKGGETIIARRK